MSTVRPKSASCCTQSRRFLPGHCFWEIRAWLFFMPRRPEDCFARGGGGGGGMGVFRRLGGGVGKMGFRAGTLCYVVLVALALASSQIHSHSPGPTAQSPNSQKKGHCLTISAYLLTGLGGALHGSRN